MKSLYEGILGDIEDTLNDADNFIEFYSIFDKIIKSNVNNFEKNLNNCINKLKTAGKKLGIVQVNKNAAWYTLSKNFIVIEKYARHTHPYEYTCINFIHNTEPENWAGFVLATNTDMKKSNFVTISNKTARMGHLSKNTDVYKYETYEMYQLPDEFETSLKLIIDKINERL